MDTGIEDLESAIEMSKKTTKIYRVSTGKQS